MADEYHNWSEYIALCSTCSEFAAFRHGSGIPPHKVCDKCLLEVSPSTPNVDSQSGKELFVPYDISKPFKYCVLEFCWVCDEGVVFVNITDRFGYRRQIKMRLF
jgi:hypothetical protein